MRRKAGHGIQLSFHQECFMIVFSFSSPVQITRHQVFLFSSEQCNILHHPGCPENKGRCSRLFDFCVQSVNTEGREAVEGSESVEDSTDVENTLDSVDASMLPDDMDSDLDDYDIDEEKMYSESDIPLEHLDLTSYPSIATANLEKQCYHHYLQYLQTHHQLQRHHQLQQTNQQGSHYC